MSSTPPETQHDLFPDGAVILHGYEAAFVELRDGRSVYDFDEIIRLDVGRGMSVDEAIEQFTFNVEGSRSCYPSVFFKGWDE